MASGSLVVAWVVCLTWMVGVHATQCVRTPSGMQTPKTIGDSGFMIKVSGHSNTYIPGDVHTVTIRSYKTYGVKKKFSKFLLVVEPAHRQENRYGLANVGTFQLQTDSLSMYSDDCPNAVTQTSPIPKKDIRVLWRAPPSGSGCVNFKVTVVEQNDQWYMDDGRLTKLMCEDAPNPKPREDVNQCCACGEAKYEVTFESLWSRQTHPKDFPSNKWLTYFSDIIGASHSPKYNIWDYGGCASTGLQQLAEKGSTEALEREMKRNRRKIRTIIKARGMRHQHFNRKSFAIFRVDKKNHLMSLVSKFAPSPDWFVGVSSLNLCHDSNCTWLENEAINLYPVDVGTNSGHAYLSKYQPTNPQQKIHRITNSFPNSMTSPFFDPSGEPMKPIARVVVHRQRLYHRDCPVHARMPNIVQSGDMDAYKPQCAVSEWTMPSCSGECGSGVRFRTRQYLDIKSAKMAACRRQMAKTEECYTGFPCSSAEDNEIIPPQCSVTQWSEWNQCSVTCGQGVMVRKRQYEVSALVESCNVSTIATRPCYGGERHCDIEPEEAEAVCHQPLEVGTCLDYIQRWFFNSSEAKCVVFTYSGCDGNRNNFVSPEDCMRTCGHMMAGYTGPQHHQVAASLLRPVNCVMSKWDEWSNCSTSCGKGRRIRTRTIMVNPQNGGKKCPRKLIRTKRCRNPKCRQRDENRCV